MGTPHFKHPFFGCILGALPDIKLTKDGHSPLHNRFCRVQSLGHSQKESISKMDTPHLKHTIFRVQNLGHSPKENQGSPNFPGSILGALPKGKLTKDGHSPFKTHNFQGSILGALPEEDGHSPFQTPIFRVHTWGISEHKTKQT